ncbi:surface-adhesin E family protein [Sphingomonas sanxanigenens]|uniref:Surface-adhesin protein E-like domain-containing protein n=1 Tax=Sphingomonas sanxanigenens DSM 19645 = NX02 TaxID=1123269 RepID=W0A7H3_9SPHN|nr:surface-adhesin E family protein [Sphingomonas sanxanigenens]AHE53889.1 hypothetical protein NX02_10875 [Sphingomonas sanxanigenens DSM 19645 = NX02]
MAQDITPQEAIRRLEQPFGDRVGLSLVRGFALSAALLVPGIARTQDLQPWAGYTTQGLAETRAPWQFRWDDPENEWLRISTDSQKATWFLQLASDLRAKDQPKRARRVWLKIDYSKQVTERAREAKALWVVDCNSQTFTVRNMTWYAPNGVVEETRSYPTTDIIPESMAATISRRVCSQ